jgi:Sulfatase-modifying factor enzyme 1
MGKYPVTQNKYEALMGRNPSCHRGQNLPVESVRWKDAQAFCQKLAQLSNRMYGLPSEAQWEYACRAGTDTQFHYGKAASTTFMNYGGSDSYNYGKSGEYLKETSIVGSFGLANDFGLYDMHGNVWEWIDLEMIDPFQVSLMTLIGWVTCDSFARMHSGTCLAGREAEPHPLNSMSSMALPFGSAQGTPCQ